MTNEQIEQVFKLKRTENILKEEVQKIEFSISEAEKESQRFDYIMQDYGFVHIRLSSEKCMWIALTLVEFTDFMETLKAFRLADINKIQQQIEQL